jgi:hypothetical protein
MKKVNVWCCFSLPAKGGVMTRMDRPNAESVVANLKVQMPLGKKLKLLLRNNFIKIIKLQNCCNHPGEPGC